MTDSQDFISSLFADFNTSWAGETAIAWPNVSFDAEDYQEFVAVRLSAPDGKLAGVGTGQSMISGKVFITAYVRQNTGILRALDLAREISKFYVNRLSSNQYRKLRNPSISELPLENGWYGIEVSADYAYIN